MPGTAAVVPGPGFGVRRVERALDPGQAAERDLGGGLPGPLGGDQPAEQRGHRGAFVGEDPDVALGTGQHERPGQGIHRGGFLAAGGQGQRPQRADLDDAAGPGLADRDCVPPVQQRERLARKALGEQYPGQHQISRLAGVVRVVAGAEAALLRPAGGSSEIALGQQQPRPLRRDGVEHPGRARLGLPGLADGRQGPRRITVGLPDPRQRHQAGGQRRGVEEPAAQRDALADMPQRHVELVPLVGHLAQAHVRGAGGRQRRPAGPGGQLQRLPVGAQRRVQAALGALNLAELVAAVCRQGRLADRPRPGDPGHERMLGLREPPTEPLGQRPDSIG